jgi:hypothetical protein
MVLYQNSASWVLGCLNCNDGVGGVVVVVVFTDNTNKSCFKLFWVVGWVVAIKELIWWWTWSFYIFLGNLIN